MVAKTVIQSPKYFVYLYFSLRARKIQSGDKTRQHASELRENDIYNYTADKTELHYKQHVTQCYITNSKEKKLRARNHVLFSCFSLGGLSPPEKPFVFFFLEPFCWKLRQLSTRSVLVDCTGGTVGETLSFALLP